MIMSLERHLDMLLLVDCWYCHHLIIFLRLAAHFPDQCAMHTQIDLTQNRYFIVSSSVYLSIALYVDPYT